MTAIAVRRRASSAVLAALAVLVTVAAVFPVYWMLNTSFLPNSSVRGPEPVFVPTDPTLRNYEVVLSSVGRAPFLPALGTSAIVAGLTVVIAVVLAFLAAVAITRFRFLGRKGVLLAVLVVQMIPAEALVISTYRMLDSWQLLNTVMGLVLVYVATVVPFTIWVLRGFVAGVPIELEQAAMIDGCSRLQAFRRITFPLLAPGLVAAGVFALIQAWNEFLLALVVMSRPDMMTLPVWLRTFQQATTTTNWAALMAGSTLMAIPVIVFFVLVQRRLSGGIAAGAVKG